MAVGNPIIHTALADVGRQRQSMQDACEARDLADGTVLLVVADGMGGAPAGEVASRLAADEAVARLSEPGRSTPFETDVPALVAAINETVWQAAQADPARAGMGTTLVLALLRGGQATIANVGDSRAYLSRGGSLRQLTADHSYVAEAVRGGRMTAEEARVHPYRNVITRVLGTQAQVQPDVYDLELEVGDRLLLCSDGLHGPLSSEGMQSVLESSGGVEDAARGLIAAANAAGGPDNIAVALAVVTARLGESESGEG